MNIARIVFGIIYLLGACFNIYLVATTGWQSYVGFADGSFFPWYRDVWRTIAAPNITLVVVVLILFEVCLGLLFIINRRFLKIALILGILFCLASMPAMVQAIYTNLPLAVIQAFLLWKECRNRPARRSMKAGMEN